MDFNESVHTKLECSFFQGSGKRVIDRGHHLVPHVPVAIEVVDPRELELPDVGLLAVVDPETGQRREIPTGSAKVRQRYAHAAAEQRSAIAAALRAAKAGVDVVEVHACNGYLLGQPGLDHEHPHAA